MRVFFASLLCMLSSVCHGQRVPISAYTYENCTDIDHYFGETDTLLLQLNIQTVKIYLNGDTEQLCRKLTYQKGKRIRVEDFNLKTGQPERTIQYTYGTDVLDAYLTHYPSPDNFNIWPSRTFYYLERMKGGNIYHPYRSDTASRVVKMHIRHTFNADGTVSFAGFNMDEQLIDTFTLRPLITWEEYQSRAWARFPDTVKTQTEEYVYNAKGKLILYIAANRQNRYFYDKRDLLEREEFSEYGRMRVSKFYKYE